MRKSLLVCCLLSIVCGLVLGCGNSTSSGKMLVSINGKKITEGDLNFLATLNPNIAAQLATPFGKKQILDNLVEQELLFQAAKKAGTQNKKEVQAKIDLYKKVIIAQSFVENSMDQEALKYYDAHKNDFDQLKLSEILIRYATPEELKAARKTKNPNIATHSEQEALKLANEVYDKIKAGGDFAKLAKQYSEDPATKDEGGNVGFVSKEDPRMSRRGYQPIVEKAFSMKVGELAGPIKTANGYHIITLTAPAEQAPFEEVKNQIVFKMRGDLRGKILSELKEKNKVVYADELQPKAEAAPDPSAPANPNAATLTPPPAQTPPIQKK